MPVVTWNPSDKTGRGVLSNNNAKFTGDGGSCSVRATLDRYTGKWYFEGRIDARGGILNVGVCPSTVSFAFATILNYAKDFWGIDAIYNQVFKNDGTYTTDGVASSYPGDIIMIAVDFDAGLFWAGRNGVWLYSGDPTAGTNPTASNITGSLYPACSVFYGADAITGLFDIASLSYLPDGFSDWAGLSGSISGTVYEKTGGVWVPGAYPVRVYNRATGELIKSAVSAVDGAYEITGLPVNVEYYVVALDDNNPYQTPGIKDKVLAT